MLAVLLPACSPAESTDVPSGASDDTSTPSPDPAGGGPAGETTQSSSQTRRPYRATTSDSPADTAAAPTTAPEAAVPAGVLPAQFDTWVGGGDWVPCDDQYFLSNDLPPVPYFGPMDPASQVVTRGSINWMCIAGFRQGEPIHIEVTPPGGDPQSFDVRIGAANQDTASDPLSGDHLTGIVSAPGDGVSSVRWLFPSTYPEGDYQLIARQGGTQFTTTFVVQDSSFAFAAAFPENHITGVSGARPGDEMRFALSGFDQSTAYVGLYRMADAQPVTPDTNAVFELYSDLVPVPIDETGSAVVSFEIGEHTPPGHYCLYAPATGEYGMACSLGQLSFVV